MTQLAPRRRILCVRSRANPRAAPFMLDLHNDWIETLALRCDVHAVDQDFDLDRLGDEVRPDLILFEPFHWIRPSPLDIKNPRAHPSVPRGLLLSCDPHDAMRPRLYDLVDRCGVEVIFDYGGDHRQQMPELDHIPCHSIPMFFDPAVFRDYGLAKTIPVSIFGGLLLPDFYTWRAKVLPEIQQLFPTLVYPHPGYEQGRTDPFAVRGEAYARLINQSHFSLADTTRLDYVVRKHLEIPAAGAVLVAPPSAALGDYGFVDLTNCIMGEGRELFEKIDAVSRTPTFYEALRAAGHTLVHGRYARGLARGVPDWLECRLSLAPGERVQQAGPLGPFRAVPDRPGPAAVDRRVRENAVTAALAFARDAILGDRKLEEADQRLQEAASWLAHMAEPFFMLGIVALLRGDPLTAAVAIGRRAQGQSTLDISLATMDPVEIAWLLLIAHVLGNAELEGAMREQAASVDHLSLRRVAWLLDPAGPDPAATDALIDRRPGDRLSIHWLGQEDFTAWCDLVRRVVAANRASPATEATTRRLIAAAA